MADFVCHGDILYSESIEKLKVFEDSYLVVQNGFVEGIYETLPEKFQGVEVKDYGRKKHGKPNNHDDTGGAQSSQTDCLG